MLKITLLRSPKIELDGRQLVFPFSRADALVYYLAVNKSAGRSELAALLWENREEANAMKQLRNTIYTVNRTAGTELLKSSSRTVIALNPELETEIDYDSVLREKTARPGMGMFLQGFSVRRADAFDDWINEIREKLKFQSQAMLRSAAIRDMDEGDAGKAAALAEEYLLTEPFDEEMVSLLMRAYCACFQYPKAAQVYRNLKDRLSEELATEPLESTTKLYYRLVNQWNDMAVPADITEKGTVERKAMAIMTDTARAFVPFSCLGGEPVTLNTERTLAEIENFEPECENDPAALRLLRIARGQLETFAGDTARGISILTQVLEEADFEDSVQKFHICCCLSSIYIYSQKPARAEIYINEGIRLLNRELGTVRSSQYQRLRGCCFSLRKSYDKASYYHLEAIETLERLPLDSAVRLQLAAAYSDYARVCRYKQGFADASIYFKKALELLGSGPMPGKTWIYMHYGRTVYYLDDHIRAADLFEKGYENALKTGEQSGKTAAAAYTAYYRAYHNEYERAACILRIALDSAERTDSALEKGILNYACMMIKNLLAERNVRKEELNSLLKFSPEAYARQGVRALAEVPDVFEAEIMADFLRDGISSRRNPKAAELYSNNRHFMTE